MQPQAAKGFFKSFAVTTQQDSASRRKLAKRNPAVGQFLIRQLANFQSGSWPTLHLEAEHIKN